MMVLRDVTSRVVSGRGTFNPSRREIPLYGDNLRYCITWWVVHHPKGPSTTSTGPTLITKECKGTTLTRPWLKYHESCLGTHSEALLELYNDRKSVEMMNTPSPH